MLTNLYKAMAILILGAGLLLTGCEDTDIGMATQAGVEAVKAVTLDDDELRFVVGHEMGHVVDDHIKNKIRLAYAGSAVRKAIASQRNEAGQMAQGVLGALAQQLVNAQFSQKEEREADDFGLAFIQSQGLSEQPAVSAMMKLASLGNDHSFLSSHPAPQARAQRLQENRSPSENAETLSVLDRIIAWLKALWPFGQDERAGLRGAGERPLAMDRPDEGPRITPLFTASPEKERLLADTEDCHGIRDGNLPPACRSRRPGDRTISAL